MCLYFCGESRAIEQKDGKKMDVCIANFLKDISFTITFISTAVSTVPAQQEGC